MPPIPLAGELTIYRVAEFCSLLQAALLPGGADPCPVVLDLRQVTEFDGAGLQLLLTLARWTADQGSVLELSAAPGFVLNLLEAFGVAGRFKINAEDPGP